MCCLWFCNFYVDSARMDDDNDDVDRLTFSQANAEEAVAAGQQGQQHDDVQEQYVPSYAQNTQLLFAPSSKEQSSVLSGEKAAESLNNNKQSRRRRCV